LANTLGRVPTKNDAVADTITSDSTSSNCLVHQKRELTSFGWKRFTTRAIPSPIKTSDRANTRLRHQTKKGMAEQYTKTLRMRPLLKAVPMTPFRSILDNLAYDDEWKRIGVTSSKRRVEECLDTLTVTTSEVD
jgi:hypothetical protein